MAIEKGIYSAPMGLDDEMEDAMEIDGAMLHAILKENRESMILNNMVKEGKSREEAETGIGLLLTILERFVQAEASLGIRGEATPGCFDLALTLKLP